MNTLFLLLADGANDAAGAFLGLGVVGLAVAAILGIFWLWMLIDALTNTRLEMPMKVVWALVIFFLPFLGALAYLFIGRNPGGGATVG